MTELVERLLDFCRESNHPLDKVAVQPSVLVQEVLAELAAQLNSWPGRWIVRDLPECRACPILLRQVFFNLISNAVKFTRGRAQPIVEVGFQQTAEERAYFVRDNGVGFDPQAATKLFLPFQRLHQEFEGTGLGLAIVRRIVQRHGGRVWAEGAVGRGATFYFTLSE
jgi:signal transduction histidine kinase